MRSGAPNKILFVCLGNICRSPLAQGIFQHRLARVGFDSPAIELDSAGTAAYHIGKAPDPRARAVAKAAGFDVDEQRARQVSMGDFERFDEIYAMDRANHEALLGLAASGTQHKVRLLMSLVEPTSPWFGLDVPDPYYGGLDGFTEVVSMLDQAASAWIEGCVQGAGHSGGLNE
ncbi:MAG TPA: low molecular weight protein-tyrosine-phosphatase [Wenzhouxiangella sp.]